MKKVYFSLLFFLSMTTLTFISCRKNQETGKEHGSAVLTAEGLAKDAAFIKLNDAANRFDPQYLIKVYKDQQTVNEIIKRSGDLLLQLQTGPENPVFQKQVADFYHFSSVVQLKEYSAAITENLKKLNEKYDFQKTLFTDGGGQIYFAARSLYAKNKIDNYPAGARKTDGLWSDFVDAYFSEFDYNTYVYDQGLEPGGESGGCSGEVCCDQLQVCKLEARNDLFSNLVTYSGGGLVSGAGLGATIGSWFGGVGAIPGAGIGLIAGGIGGASLAFTKYSTSLDICKAKYQLCIDLKKQK